MKLAIKANAKVFNAYCLKHKHCWHSNTKCPAERTRPSLFLTNNPEMKSNVCLLFNFPENQKSGRTANQ